MTRAFPEAFPDARALSSVRLGSAGLIFSNLATSARASSLRFSPRAVSYSFKTRCAFGELLLRELGEPGHPLLHVRVEVCLGSTPERGAEPVTAVDGDGDGLYVDDVEDLGEVLGSRRVLFRWERQRCWPVVDGPESIGLGGVEQEQPMDRVRRLGNTVKLQAEEIQQRIDNADR